MSKRQRFALTATLGCLVLSVLVIVALATLLLAPLQFRRTVVTESEAEVAITPVRGARATQEAIPTLTLLPESVVIEESTAQMQLLQETPGIGSGLLTTLYQQINPGVVNIQVYVDQGALTGQGAGSGFVLNDEGYIITNNHVVAQAEQVTAVFYNELEAEAQIIGADADSDLAVIKVDQLPDGVHPLPVGDSDQVDVGQWVVAIGNPFGQQSSMSVGIVSAVGRTIPSGVTPFSIPQAIQTDAAINPGNSGGPLLNLRGEIIGVNAQIATGGNRANSGVGFAIPANVVRRVAPVLIETGTYQWPWLGVQGGSVNLAIKQANNLETQRGAYIDDVVSGGPADEAGLEGSSGTREINDVEIPVGGDVVVAVDGESITDFNDLLARVAFMHPGDEVVLSVIRNNQRQVLTVELAARPENFDRQRSGPSTP